MEAGRLVKAARMKAGLSQRAIAERTGFKQPAIARIESRRVKPRTDTLDRLLEACGIDLESAPRLGQQVDRTMIRELLRLTPGERARLAAQEQKRLSEVTIH